MNNEQFLKASFDMTKYIINYGDTIRERRVLSNVEPGYLRKLLPEHAPETPDVWEDILKDVEYAIMPGITHWHSPKFNAFFPAGRSYPAIVADMLSGAIGCIGFSWMASPACTELEVLMMDWLGELINLPKEFLAKHGGTGGGIIQGTASEATLISLLTAKKRIEKKWDQKNAQENNNMGKLSSASLVAYASDQSHCSIERAAMLAGIKIRLLPTDSNCSLRGSTLKKAIEEDLHNGLHPFFVAATMGTTSSCAFDNVKEIGEISKQYEMWAHVDAAYAGSAFICEEFQYLMEGIELLDSFNFNPHKWLLVNFDCSAMWVKNANELEEAYNVDPVYLKHKHQGNVPDYRHWQIPCGRRFRSLKLWFVLRLYGKVGLQNHIRNQINLAKEFEAYLVQDSRFEIVAPVIFGLVCFRLKGLNEMNKRLHQQINDAGLIHLVAAEIKDVYFLRFVVCSSLTESSDILIAWKEIQKRASNLVQLKNPKIKKNRCIENAEEEINYITCVI